MSTRITEPRPHRSEQTAPAVSIPAAELLLFCRDLRGSVIDVVVAASGRALLATPEPDGLARRTGTGIGVAVDTDSGLSIPVVRNAASGPLPAVQAEVTALVAAARDGALSAADVGGAAVTVCEYPLDPARVARETRSDVVLVVEWAGVDSLELALHSPGNVSEIGHEEAGRFFATVVRLLQHPYRLLV